MLAALSALQAGLLLASGYAVFIPGLAIVGLLGLVVIKQSAATRDSLTRLTSGNNEMLRTHKAMQQRLSEIERAQHNSGRALSLVREHVGRTGAQFDWLADRALAEQSSLADLQQHAERVTLSLAAQESLGEATRQELAEFAVASSTNAAEVVNAVSPIVERLSDTISVIDRRTALAFDGGNSHSLERRIVSEISAMNLLAGSRSGAALPPFEGWSMAPLAVRYSESVATELAPNQTIVELGSGVSTAWLAYALAQKEQRPRFVSVDHDAAFGAATAQSLSRLGLDGVAEVVVAPLRDVTIDEGERRWYDTAWLSGVENVGLLIVDGPPAGKVHAARYPALPLLVERLADEAIILVDDADRPGESDMVAQWMKIADVRQMGMVGRSMVLKYTRSGEDSE
jgi:predicted O-methyltransferase YrrM